MSEIKTGGPAFPVNRTNFPEDSVYANSVVISDGVTLREYFAAKAMQGILSNPNTKLPDFFNGRWGDVPEQQHSVAYVVSEFAYVLADFMLDRKELKK